MIYALLREFGITDNRVLLGLSRHMSKDKRHGVVHYEGMDGVRHIGFLADKPGRLGRSDKEQVTDLFRQLDRIGYVALSLEVKRGRGAFLIKRPTGALAAARLRAL
ncbi:hypothetical protein [Burkholderia phage FLC9]|nr:hypothetical protein [Burkholderia phage FLC9]